MCDACVGKGGSLNDEAENVYVFLSNEAPYTKSRAIICANALFEP